MSLIRAWYLRSLGEVPTYVEFLWEYRPGLLKVIGIASRLPHAELYRSRSFHSSFCTTKRHVAPRPVSERPRCWGAHLVSRELKHGTLSPRRSFVPVRRRLR